MHTPMVLATDYLPHVSAVWAKLVGALCCAVVHNNSIIICHLQACRPMILVYYRPAYDFRTTSSPMMTLFYEDVMFPRLCDMVEDPKHIGSILARHDAGIHQVNLSDKSVQSVKSWAATSWWASLIKPTNMTIVRVESRKFLTEAQVIN